MNKYIFKTTATMKPHNSKKWWIDGDIIPDKQITADSVKDSLKKYMEENGLDTIAGSEHKASYKAVTSSRIDTTALKRDMPEIAAKYTKTTKTRRFLFV